MILTKPQQTRFWREWTRACTTQGWTRANAWTTQQIETERHALLDRAGFSSLTQVDRGSGFDRLLAELGRLSDNLAATAEIDDPDAGLRRRYLHLVLKKSQPLGGLAYALAIARDQYHITEGLNGIEDLTTNQLLNLIKTLTARSASKARKNAQVQPENQPF